MSGVYMGKKPKQTEEEIELLRKRDAMALAELLLDIYKERKIKESPNADKGESHEKLSTQRQRPKRIQKDK